ncbi:MAG: cobalamin-binding protein, partial [Conexibacter sp.]
MRIVSLVPSATEILFALGLGDEVVAVTHECDYPPAARELPTVTRDALPPDLSAGQIDAAVGARTDQGEAINQHHVDARHQMGPEHIVTHAL